MFEKKTLLPFFPFEGAAELRMLHFFDHQLFRAFGEFIFSTNL